MVHRTMRRRAAVLACSVGLVTGGLASSSRATSGTTAATTAGTAAAAAGPGDFGDLTGVCGPGDAKGATDQGVTDTEITVGTASDPGAQQAPGLNQELFDAADAFVSWCNKAGGINGRTLKLNKHDAKLFEVGPRMVEACQTDFMLVGDGMALDSMGVQQREKCGLAQIAAYTVSQEAGRSKDSIEAMPNSDRGAHLLALLRSLKEKDPEAIQHFGMWNSDFASITPTGNRTRVAAEFLGYKMVDYETLPSQGVDNYRPYVEKLKAAGVQVFIDYHSPVNMIQAFKAMADVGYYPKYVLLEGNFYNQSMITEIGAGLDKTTMLVNAITWPFELADQNPATAQFIQILKDNGGFAPKALGVNAFSAWLLWAQSATACGSDLTRACVMQKATAVTDWTGGGLHVPFKPGQTTEMNSECVGLVQATSAGFVAATDKWFTPNDRIFYCDPKNNTPVDQLPNQT